MEAFSSWRRCSPTADIRGRNLRRRLQKFCRISTLKSSNVPIRSADLWSCQNAGSSSAPLPGSIAAAAWPRIGRISTEKRSRSCASPQSASCSENYAIRPELSGRTLSDLLHAWAHDHGTGPGSDVTLAVIIEKALKTKKMGGQQTDEFQFPDLNSAVRAAAFSFEGKSFGSKLDPLTFGSWCKGKKGRIVDGLRLANKRSSRGDAATWWVEKTK